MAQLGINTMNEAAGHTLVHVFLRGGADGLTLVPPTGDDIYHNARPTLRIGEGDAQPLDGYFGLHPLLAPLYPFYESGALAIVHAAGTEEDSRSHFEAQDWMEHGGLHAGGWLGRYLRQRGGSGPVSAIALARTQPELLRGAPASVTVESLDAFKFPESGAGFQEELAALYAMESGTLREAGENTLRAMDKLNAMDRKKYKPEHGAEYPRGGFGDSLRQIAQVIKSGLGLEAACVDLDGWDAHFASGALMTPLMETLAKGLAAFCTDLGTRMEHATVAVTTEFGRRLYENGSLGTDHGRGSVMMVLGGGVRGGKVYGEWPGLAADALDGPGDVAVTTNYRNVLASVLAHHGGTMDYSVVFPGFEINPLPIYG